MIFIRYSTSLFSEALDLNSAILDLTDKKLFSQIFGDKVSVISSIFAHKWQNKLHLES